MSNKSVKRGRRSAKRKKPAYKRNYNCGKKLSEAIHKALDQHYGSDSHFNTRATHKRRASVFVRYCKRCGMNDARRIDQEFILQFGAYIRARLNDDYEWPDGHVDEQISVAYAHNAISTVNTVMRAFRGDDALKVSGREVLGVCRQSVRTKEIEADVLDTKHAADLAIAAGFERGAAVILLARAWGMRVRECILQDLDRMKREIEATGEAAILRGCKGGRKATDRTIKASEFRMEALRYAIEVRPEGSRNLLSETDTVKSFLLNNVNPCRQFLQSSGIPHFMELRAGFAQDIYEEVMGGPSPLKEPIRDKVMDRIARAEVARQLGHNRVSVASSYVGGTRNAI
ncbi:integrase domain-containing protein [Marinobacter bryozoorum]|uniref:integrase domain-containing protein n=1 Tax=Marinobacter bryozoorum TaxID=256324 RepID=UPI0020032D3E|nr:integrase domain-containing protein [Marinobacter bryozoorum]MCK7545910.1 integrase domain-containing protein [Marinobacter bryozoorum]